MSLDAVRAGCDVSVQRLKHGDTHKVEFKKNKSVEENSGRHTRGISPAQANGSRQGVIPKNR